jgi:hypothetical protein
MKMKWFEVDWSSSRRGSAGNVAHFQAFATLRRTNPVKSEGHENGFTARRQRA